MEPGAPPRAAFDLVLAARVAGEMRIIVGVRVDGLGENWDVARYVATTNFRASCTVAAADWLIAVCFRQQQAADVVRGVEG